jgi:ABC-type sugar transport system permease subunit
MSAVSFETAEAQRPPVQTGATLFILPSSALLFLWMLVPLGMTLYFSVEHYNLLSQNGPRYTGIKNYRYRWNAARLAL